MKDEKKFIIARSEPVLFVYWAFRVNYGLTNQI